jgi:hypothetical protein
LQLGAAAHQAPAVGAAEVGIGTPALVAELEAVLALQPGDELPAVAGPGETLRLGRGPGVEAAAQIEGPAVQRRQAVAAGAVGAACARAGAAASSRPSAAAARSIGATVIPSRPRR